MFWGRLGLVCLGLVLMCLVRCRCLVCRWGWVCLMLVGWGVGGGCRLLGWVFWVVGGLVLVWGVFWGLVVWGLVVLCLVFRGWVMVVGLLGLVLGLWLMWMGGCGVRLFLGRGWFLLGLRVFLGLVLVLLVVCLVVLLRVACVVWVVFLVFLVVGLFMVGVLLG